MNEADRTRRDALARTLCARICDDRRSLDELLVADKLFARIELGADRYGPLDLSKPRDWDCELAEELLDVQVYRAIVVLEREKQVAPRVKVAPSGILLDFAMPEGDE